MKAVYVLKEMPSVCMKCPFCQFYAYGLTAETFCILTAKKNEDGINTKAEFCPLRSLPERKEMPKNFANKDYTQGLVDGWNRCWDEVTGVIWD